QVLAHLAGHCLVTLLGRQLTLRQHKELLSMAGWLAALVGCVEYDSVNRAAAEAIRQTAWKLGDQCGDAEVMACSVASASAAGPAAASSLEERVLPPAQMMWPDDESAGEVAGGRTSGARSGKGHRQREGRAPAPPARTDEKVGE